MIPDSELRRQVTLARQPFRALLAERDLGGAFPVNPEHETIAQVGAELHRHDVCVAPLRGED